MVSLRYNISVLFWHPHMFRMSFMRLVHVEMFVCDLILQTLQRTKFNSEYVLH